MSSDWDFNFYDELGVPKTASQDEIKKAYKKMAIKWHPDKNVDNPESTEKFQRISHAYSILSDPKKRDYYDRYGKLDEDNFNFEEFMKGFTFDFGEMFGDPFFMQGGMMEGRHSIKLMSIRKAANSQGPEVNENFEKLSVEFPTFIYGQGTGYESKSHLTFKKKSTEDDEWEKVDEEENVEANDEEIEECEEEEDLLEFFVMSNSTAKGKKVTCNYCLKTKANEDECVFDKKTINKHFIDNHKSDFELFFGPEASWEECVESEKKKSKGKKNKKGKNKGGANPFGGMPFMMDMGQMFNLSEEEQELMMKDFEKMMGGFGMGGGMGGFPGMGGMGGFPGMGGMGGFPGMGGMGGFPGMEMPNDKKKKKK